MEIMKVYTLTHTTQYPSEFDTYVFATIEAARKALKEIRDDLLEQYDEAEILDDDTDQFYMECEYTGNLTHLEINETKIK